jgi:hypothetical protein
MFGFPNYGAAACSEIRMAFRDFRFIATDKIEFLTVRLRGMPPALRSPSADKS